jgi:hypothetical protein
VRSLPPERIPTLYLQAIPGHAIVRSRFTLSASWRALSIGEASDLIGQIPETLLVWRQGLEVTLVADTFPWTLQSVHGYPERTSDRKH